MQPQPARWRAIILGILGLQVPVGGAFFTDGAWVRKYSCGEPRTASDVSTSLESIPFQANAMRGKWETLDKSTLQLNLSILSVYSPSLFSCEDIDLEELEHSADFQILGHPVGQLSHLRATCPLPVTDDLTPCAQPWRFFCATFIRGLFSLTSHSIGKTRLASYNLIYTFPSKYRLRTLTAAFRFKRPNGTELDCAMAKITMDLGSSIKTSLIIVSTGTLATVALASWRIHLRGRPTRHDAIMAGQGPLWAMILDVTKYLRLLQFIFISGAVTVEFPGFYLPVISQLSWASLLFWKGVIHRGHKDVGIDQGMYVSNSSYGWGMMTQMLGYPNMLNTLINSSINLAMLVVPAFFVLTWGFLTAAKKSSFLSTTKRAAAIAVGMSLCLFSVPLLSFMAYDLVLIGYLPTFRIVLAVLMVLTIIGANFFLIGEIDKQLRYEPISPGYDSQGDNRRGSHFGRIWGFVRPHVPHALPQVQAIGVGALQDYAVAQITILGVCEAVDLLELASAKDARLLYSLGRLLVTFLTIPFVGTLKELTRECLGYTMLGLHGCCLLAALIESIWQIFQSFQAGNDDCQQHSSQNHSAVMMDDFPSRSYSSRLEYRRSHFGRLSEQRWHDAKQQDFSTFYRAPRSRNSTPGPYMSRQASTMDGAQSDTTLPSPLNVDDTEDFPHLLGPIQSGMETSYDLSSALASVPATIDYSFREVDRIYGTSVATGDTESSDATTPSATSTSRGGQADVSERSGWWKRVSSFDLNFLKNKVPAEKGFSVTRPPRPLNQPLPQPSSSLQGSRQGE